VLLTYEFLLRRKGGGGDDNDDGFVGGDVRWWFEFLFS